MKDKDGGQIGVTTGRTDGRRDRLIDELRDDIRKMKARQGRLETLFNQLVVVPQQRDRL